MLRLCAALLAARVSAWPIRPCRAGSRSQGSKDDKAGVQSADVEQQARIALTTFLSAGRDGTLRTENVPRADGVDAFLYVDRETFSSARARPGIERWRALGWEIHPVDLEPASPLVSSKRLTAERIKFRPPARLLGYEWLVSIDSKTYIAPGRLAPFLARHARAAATLLDWRHFLGLGGARLPFYPERPAGWPAEQPTGFECLGLELSAIAAPGGPLHCLVSSNASRVASMEWYLALLDAETRSRVDNGTTAFPKLSDNASASAR